MITTSEILSRTTDLKIFHHYLKSHTEGRELRTGEKILSPLRVEENPSFNIYQSAEGWRYKDFGNGDQGNCFDLVMKLFDLTFPQALEKINTDMNLKISVEGSDAKDQGPIKPAYGKTYQAFQRQFTELELKWWGQYGIGADILRKYGVIAFEKFTAFSEGKGKNYTIKSSPEKFIFGYNYGESCRKIYQPFGEKGRKFFFIDPKKKDKNFIFGLEQVPATGGVVIYTGGEKDVLSLAAMGFPAITGNSETGRIPRSVITDLQARGIEVFIMFDTDSTGLQKSAQFSLEYELKRVVLPDMPDGGKDVSDYAKQKLPVETLTALIEKAEVVTSESQNDEAVVTLSAKEFANDIWMFGIDKDGFPQLKGLYRYGIMQLLERAGFYKRCKDNTYLLIREEANIIQEIEVFIATNMVQNYVQQMSAPLVFDYLGAHIEIPVQKLIEIFLRQSHTIFNETFLSHLSDHTKPILRDGTDHAQFFFKNTVVKVTVEGIQCVKYSDMNEGCIWKSFISKRDFEYVAKNLDCHFAKFIHNVTNGNDERKAAFNSAIGYLLHNYTEPSNGQAIIAYDEEIADIKSPAGGTGKGVIANALRMLRDTVKIDGKKYSDEDKFRFQDLGESSQVIWIDDVKPNFPFDSIHSCLTDGWSIEKKHKAQIFIRPEDSPKTFITSNSVIGAAGTTNLRRQFTIELSNHYSKHIVFGNEKPIVEEHGCVFFTDYAWDKNEWNKFNSYMLDCVCYYLKNGLQYYEPINLEQNRLRQSTSEEFCEYIESKEFQPEIEYNTKEVFEEFRDIHYGPFSDFTQRGFTNWMKKYAASKGWTLQVKRSNSVSKFVFQAARRSGPIV